MIRKLMQRQVRILPDLVFDTATALSQGRRDRQEDAVSADFQAGTPLGFAVLSDGMGGHAGGDIASKIVVTEVFAELKLRSGTPEDLAQSIVPTLTRAAEGANSCLAQCAETDPARRGMGATLLAPVIIGRKLYWVSVGDSPLFLLRDGRLRRLNADHSMAARLDRMVAAGQINPEAARRHPDRACVTSVLAGRKIAEIDCPAKPLTLRPRDIVLAASDGVMSMDLSTLEQHLVRYGDLPASQLAQHLLAEVSALGCADQDNLAFCVIRVLPALMPASNPLPDARQLPHAPRQKFQRRRTTLVAVAQHQGGQLQFQSLSKTRH